MYDAERDLLAIAKFLVYFCLAQRSKRGFKITSGYISLLSKYAHACRLI